MADASHAAEARYARDRQAYLEHDPYAGHEIELKLRVDAAADPFALLARLEAQLRAGALAPYAFDPFWTVEKAYVGDAKLALDTFVFARPGPDGTPVEAFKVVVGLGKCRIREKQPAPSAEAPGFVIDRTEHDDVVEDGSALELLRHLDRRLVATGTPATYAGHYRRELRCLACLHLETRHKYALMMDRCTTATGERLQQLELEYIWRREPLGRAFTRDELYDDMARLAGLLMEAAGHDGGRRLLAPTRQTKFAWLTKSPVA